MKNIADTLEAFLSLCALSCVLSCAPGVPSTASFAPDLKPGSSWKSGVAVEQSIAQTIGGREMKTEQYFSTTYRFTVLGRGLKGELSIEAVYDRLVLKMKSPTGNYSYDSALNEDLSSPLAALRGLVGGRLTFALGSDLRIGEIGGLPELSARIAAAARNPALAVVAAATMGEAPIRRSLESIFGLFPKGHVAAGDSWAMEASPTEGSSGSGALAASRCKITAVKVNGDRFSAKVEAIPAGPAGGEASMLCGALSGHVELDSARLRVLSGAMKMDIDGSVIVRGTKIPTKIKSAMHFE